MINRYIQFFLIFASAEFHCGALTVSLSGALRAIACPSAKKWICPKVHCEWVSESLCAADRTLWLQLSESTANFFHTLSNKFHNCVSLVIAKTQICSVIRNKIGIANEKLMQYIKNTSPNTRILYRMKQSYRGNFSDFLPTLVLNSHTVTVSRLGKAFILLDLNLHTKTSHCCINQVWNLKKQVNELKILFLQNTLHIEM